MLELLTLPPFRELSLTVSFTSNEIHDVARKLSAQYVASYCETRSLESFVGFEKEMNRKQCYICEDGLITTTRNEGRSDGVVKCFYQSCKMCCHVSCLRDHFHTLGQDDNNTKKGGSCPKCHQLLRWQSLTQQCEPKQIQNDGVHQIESSNASRDVKVNENDAKPSDLIAVRKSESQLDVSLTVSKRMMKESYLKNRWIKECEDVGRETSQKAYNDYTAVEVIDLT
ncbi:hypothetical protein CCR75_006448 [Bremia lactucae]|uniref:Structure-specific endonuclease subunit SLX1 C-terminal domain-containing protein n=1 Tax=Bremia lactucae TaxID=4779 RepID=A0A976FNT1_BRELC|nr:hypothetical protein CCR75_006448 [Bremia lactucae]